MLKGNSYIIVFSLLFFVIILFVSSTPIIIKTLLIIITIGLLSPTIRMMLFKEQSKKIKVALYSSLTFALGFYCASFTEESSFYLHSGEIFFFLTVLFFSLVGNFIYGIPVSLLAEFISRKHMNFRVLLSGMIYIGFGCFVYLIDRSFYIPAMICSVLFFIYDEVSS